MAAAAAAGVLAPAPAFHGRNSSASSFPFSPPRPTPPLRSQIISSGLRISSPSKTPLRTEPLAGRLLLKKIRRAQNLPQQRLVEEEDEESGGFALRRKILQSVFLLIPFFITCGTSLAAVDDSIRASALGLKVATALRKSGWFDEAIVFFLATLPVIELRGAIPVGYWMRLDPLSLTIVSVLGNMVPVPFIVFFLKKIAAFLSKKSDSATKFLDVFFERAREKAGPVMEFQWLGLMLFVAVPFPGTGAWTGAIVAAVLDMPFWSAFSANFCGVVIAGLLVNLLVNLGVKQAVMVGILLFFISTVMWSLLRSFRSTLASK
ncbi:hypothetical protein KSP40_PGU011595 [Platanthera guangdongensis]|uniref:Small multi-drug export protein n=1 Tax=Platanthera guangdongensis TaxID=2320717 RepID=A0ABR2MJD0_9ASPA